MLRFLGRGSAFHTNNNCAFFVSQGTLVLLDCPSSALNRIRHIGIDELAGTKTQGVTVFVTHTHADHIGGIGSLIHYCYYIIHIPVEIVVPSDEVAKDISYLTERLDGCCKKGYTIITADKLNADFTAKAIPTSHTPELEGRCFGWCLEINGRRVVYTGDTNTLGPYMEYLEKDTLFYSEIALHDSGVHISFEELEKRSDEIKGRGTKVFLMHLDDEQAAGEEAEKLGVQLAPLY